MAYKKFSPEEYVSVCELLQSAKVALQDREKKLAEAYEQIEKDLVLLGATAVEDRSAEGGHAGVERVHVCAVGEGRLLATWTAHLSLWGRTDCRYG